MTRLILLATAVLFPLLASANPSFLKAAKKENWDEVIRLLEEDPTIDVNYTPSEGLLCGYTAIYHAAEHIRFDIVEMILAKFPHVDIGSSVRPASGNPPSVIWLAGFYNRWELVKHLLERFPQINVDFSHNHGPYANRNLLRLAARANRWDVIKILILQHASTDFEATLANELLPAPIVKLMLILRLLNNTSEDIESIIDRKYQSQSNGLWELFEQVVWAMPSECEALNSNQIGWYNLPFECQEIIAVNTLRAKDPDLEEVPRPLLRRALELFRRLPILVGETVPRADATAKREREELDPEGVPEAGDLKRQVFRDFPYL